MPGLGRQHADEACDSTSMCQGRRRSCGRFNRRWSLEGTRKYYYCLRILKAERSDQGLYSSPPHDIIALRHRYALCRRGDEARDEHNIVNATVEQVRRGEQRQVRLSSSFPPLPRDPCDCQRVLDASRCWVKCSC